MPPFSLKPMRRLSFVVAGLLGGMPALGTNLLVNGSFEAESVPANWFLAGTTPAGWLSYGSQAPDILTVGYSGGTAAEGVNFLDLIGGGAGSIPAGISQAVTLTAGMTYSVSFHYNGDHNSPRALKYSLGSLLSGTLVVSGLNNFAQLNPVTTAWSLFSALVSPGTTGTYVLSLYTDTPTASFGSPYVDNVSVEAMEVPESSGLAMLLDAGGTVLALNRRRRG